MIGVICFAEPIEESVLGDVVVWRNILSKIGVDFYYIVDTTGDLISKDEPYRVESFGEALKKLKEEHPECKTVSLDLFNSNPIESFEHPKDVCYIFGKDGGENFNPEADYHIILQPKNIWAVNACCMVFQDRFSRSK